MVQFFSTILQQCVIFLASFCGGFKVDKEDIVVEENTTTKVPAAITAVNAPSLVPSQPLEVLFIERKGMLLLTILQTIN